MTALSIIIPMHNGAATIEATLDSLASNPGVTLDVIVVDDRSTDDGPARALHHALRPRVVTSSGPGIGATRNTGLGVARGAHVIFLDADDLMSPNALVQRVARVGDGVLVSRYRERLHDSVRSKTVLADVERTGDARLGFLRRNQFAVHCATIPRAVLGDALFRTGTRGLEDWDLWLRLAYRGVRFTLNDVEDCEYVLRSSMTNSVVRSATEQLDLLGRARALVQGVGDPAFRARAVRELRAAQFEARLWRAVLHVRAREGGAVIDAVRAFADVRTAVSELPALAAVRIEDRAWRRRAGRTFSDGSHS